MFLIPASLCLLSFDLDPGHPRVKHFVAYLRNDRAVHVDQSMIRAQVYIPMIREQFQERSIPDSLIWIPLIESGFTNHAVSPKDAVGMFQFTADTARHMGLVVNREKDERTDPRRAARACADYLAFLRGVFGSWELALAAYVSGETKVRRICTSWRMP